MSQPAVAIYTRISQDRAKTEKGVSVQQQDCLQYAEANNLNVIESIKENDVSAAGRAKRKGFERLKELAQTGMIKGVVVWHPDRLYRTLTDLESLIAICDVYAPGFRVFAVRAGVVNLDIPDGRQQARILTAVSQHEIEHKAQRQSRAQQRVFDEGNWGGGRPPTGYKRGKSPGSLVVDEPTAHALRTVVARILTGQGTVPKYGITAATRDFRKMTGRANLKPVSLRGTLLGPAIVGMRSYVPEKQKRAAVAAKTPIPTGTRSAAKWAPIIDHQTQEDLRVVLESFDERGRPKRSLLSGILVCGRCGVTMGYSKHSYKCSFTAGGCASVGVSTSAIEKHVIEVVGHVVTHGQFKNLMVMPKPVLPPRKDELDALAARQQTLVSMFSRGLMTEELLEKGLAEAKAMAADIHASGAVAKAVAEAKREEVLGAADEWVRSAGSPERMRLVIAATYPEIIIKPVGKRNGCTFDVGRVRVSRATGHNKVSTLLKKKWAIEQKKLKMASENDSVPETLSDDAEVAS